MKNLILLALFMSFTSFTITQIENNTDTIESSSDIIYASFSLVNDTKEKVSIHTGTGFVSLNKGSKTSITCKTGKKISWANNGKVGDLIFKVENKHCGRTIKLSSEL